MSIFDCYKNYEKLSAEVRKAKKAGNQKKFKNACARLLTSSAVKRIAHEETRKKSRKKRNFPIFDDIKFQLNLKVPCDEVVRVTNVSKEDGLGSCRLICDFGPANRTRQTVLELLLRGNCDVSGAQMVFKGGRNKAIDAVKENYKEGYVHVVEMDIQSCYKSFNIDRISEFLSVPESIVSNVLPMDAYNLRPSLRAMGGLDYQQGLRRDDPMSTFRMLFADDWPMDRQGIAEGSSVSPRVAEILLAPVCQALTESGFGRVVNFADNFLLMARSMRARGRLQDILRRELHDHPAGPLMIKESDLKLPMNGDELFPDWRMPTTLKSHSFSFLGYDLEGVDGELQVQPSAKNFKKLRKLRQNAHAYLRTSKLRMRAYRAAYYRIERKHAEILRGFPQWPGRQMFHEVKMAKLLKYYPYVIKPRMFSFVD